MPTSVAIVNRVRDPPRRLVRRQNITVKYTRIMPSTQYSQVSARAQTSSHKEGLFKTFDGIDPILSPFNGNMVQTAESGFAR